MKYLITESQIDKIIFKYLDNQDFIIIEKKDNVDFVNSENDVSAQIRYDKKNGGFYINYHLRNEISSIFSLDVSDTIEIISKWVENILGMKVLNTIFAYGYNPHKLKIPK